MTTPHPRVVRLAFACFTAVVLAAGLAAQAPAPPQQPPQPQQPTFKAGVSFVRVDVYPSAKGQIVGDLQRNEFEVLEDGIPQRIETFEHIVARAPGPVSERTDPRSQAESNEMAADPRNRLFVLFFDTLHTVGYRGRTPGTSSSGVYDPRTIGRALAGFLDQLVGPDDLVALMRPEMSVDTLVFTRRPSSFDQFLLTGGEWQKRFLQGELDETERKYDTCYMTPEEQDIARKMIARRRELLAIDAIRSLVAHLENLREGRKAVILVSEGWTLFGKDNSLARPLRGQMPTGPAIGVVGGKPTIGGSVDQMALERSECERDRVTLAGIDNERDFRVILDEANRANVSFYTMNPGGLTAQSDFTRTGDSLATLATATDGLAIPRSNNFAVALQRIRDDLSSYYLLGYNSTNTKTDGKFRAISVRVKRPGVTVRARRGYLAATEAEVAARTRASAPRDPETDRREKALSLLGTERRDQPFHLGAAYLFETAAGAAARPVLWVTGELEPAAARSLEWSGGGDAAIAVSGANGQAVATGQASITTAVPRFTLRFTEPRLAVGDYLVKVRLRGKAGGVADAGSQVRVTVPDVSARDATLFGRPMLFRRGPYTGAGFQPTADLRFRKAERIRVDVPVALAPSEPLEARLLDRKGQPLPIPVTAGQREEAASRFATAEITLAPLAPGDYLVELSVRRGDRVDRTVTAFRIVP